MDKEYVMSIFPNIFSPHRCIICMEDMNEGDQIRHLPCMHAFHVDCIDDWLTRKFQCPACMEPIEMGLFAAFSLAHEAPTTAWVCKGLRIETKQHSHRTPCHRHQRLCRARSTKRPSVARRSLLLRGVLHLQGHQHQRRLLPSQLNCQIPRLSCRLRMPWSKNQDLY